MDKQEILDSVLMLAHSQGFYGRLYEELLNNENALNYLVAQDFEDVLDLILFLEQ